MLPHQPDTSGRVGQISESKRSGSQWPSQEEVTEGRSRPSVDSSYGSLPALAVGEVLVVVDVEKPGRRPDSGRTCFSPASPPEAPV
ncbi:hypothetical protein BG452_15750 [Streptomyces sp. CBMA123]|nr:hypothetical protein [Streptomyces sp. CBMA123]